MASGNMKDIKRRIKSVQSTMQITKAMELVASSKMRRAKERALAARPYFNTMYRTVARLAAATRSSESVYTRRREVRNSLFIVIAGDRGLAGGYNANVFKLAAAEMEGKNAQVITIGKKAQEHYAKRPWPVAADYPAIAEGMKIGDTHPIVDGLLRLFREGKADEIFLCYTEFVSPLQQEAKCLQLLPARFEDAAQEAPAGPRVLTEYDPSPEAVFDAVIPEYLYGVLYGAVVESYCSEQSARRMAMEAASDNASEMIENLNLSYNRARQAAITQEITEIVAGSGEVGA
ncbi:ATP synthase F1 subunit gamma [Agathobaculum sp. NSJ-28]|uniref:ATP synthase gamma chain n=2 Tax=Agathobaculum TaxID=2048137 RepID=A0A923RUH1_9FIRM|nr:MULTISPECIES: ATP synthase F1 subunit gamma [Butyricicoccaceae]MBS6882793.1 ATP synthase F1 subunit gamma [Clostridiaceae bacterium]SCI37157.1 Na(+)-translocating ATPase gamma chain [uncultured Butyricicoccus sp.]MBC5723884.1 ATP synthase F1 subunit gamma [Agathobaculum faecis]MCU6787505.1 ATP synthase F1 subunit gamma [Agathobaculum ammoniilyticum]WOC74225.1 ATP synthase F1 subunit gamma [Intestinibacillus sp. NTUH-41-i26]